MQTLPESAIQIKALTKSYGQNKVLDNLSLTVDCRDVFCLLGPNGCGKTTMINSILSLLKTDSGSIYLKGELKKSTAQNKIGVVLEEDGFFKDMSVEKNLQVVCMISKAPFNIIPDLLEKVSLLEHRKKQIKNLSQGMRKRLAIAGSLIGNHDLYIWDEPFNGLDPQGFKLLRELISEIKNKGHTIIISTHLLDEATKICNKFGLMRNGSIHEVLSLKELQEKYSDIENFFFNAIK